MEILKNLSEAELDGLKRVFESSNGRKALPAAAFRHALWRLCQSKPVLARTVTKAYLAQLFVSVDVTGSGFVSWGDFSMFAIDQARENDRHDGTALPLLPLLPSSSSSREGRRTNRGGGGTGSGLQGSRKGGHKPSRVSMYQSLYGDAHARGARDLDSASLSSSSMDSCLGDDDGTADGRASPSRSPYNALGGAHTPESSTDNIAGGSSEAAASRRTPTPGAAFDEFTAFRPFHVDHVIPQRHGMQVADMRLLARPMKIVQVVDSNKGTSDVSVFSVGDEWVTLYAKVPRHSEAVTAWEYVPPAGGVSKSNTLACAYNGGLVQLFTLEKKHSIDEKLPLCVQMRVSETQTSLQWASLYSRLLMGSRGGVVSSWELDSSRLASQEKLHGGAVTSMRVHNGSTLYTASLDRFNSVKATDLERSVVRHAFSDHLVGGALNLELDDEFLFTSGLEPKIVQRVLQTPKAHPSYLHDSQMPHQGRVSTMQRLPSSPLLMSGDTKGYVKLWDLRMGLCVQTIAPTTLTSVKNRVVAPASLTAHEADGPRGEEAHRRRRRDGAGARERHPQPLTARSYQEDGARESVRERNVPVPAGDKTANAITALCVVPAKNLVMVSTCHEVVALTSANTSCPDLADDERPCLFVLFPSAEVILTVHDGLVKTWSTLTGHLLQTSGKEVVLTDIATCCLVEPLRRQFVLGSMRGELSSFSVSLTQPVSDFTPVLREAGVTQEDTPIIAVASVPKLRDQNHPFLVVATPFSAVLLPVAGNRVCTPSSLVLLRGLCSVVAASGAVMKDASVREQRLYVATSSGAVHLVDLQQVGSVTATFRPPTVAGVDTVVLGGCDIRAVVSGASRAADDPHDPTGVVRLLFCPDSTGRVVVGEAADLRHERATEATAAPQVPPQDGDGGASRADGELLEPRAQSTLREASSAASADSRNHQSTAMEQLALLGEWTPAVAVSTGLLSDKERKGDGGAEKTWRSYRRSNGAQYVQRGTTAVSVSASNRESPGDPAGVLARGQNARQILANQQELSRLGAMAAAGTSTVAATAATATSPQRSTAMPDLSTRAPAITHMHFFDDFALLVTGDERGNVRLWDLQSLVLDCVRNLLTSERAGVGYTEGEADGGEAKGGRSISRVTSFVGQSAAPGRRTSPFLSGQRLSGPALLSDWHAHDGGFTTLAGVLCPRTGLPLVVTAGVDRSVRLWSSDGAALGGLATGRELDDASGGHRYGLGPYPLATASDSRSALEERWAGLRQVLAQRTATQNLEQQLPRGMGTAPQLARNAVFVTALPSAGGILTPTAPPSAGILSPADSEGSGTSPVGARSRRSTAAGETTLALPDANEVESLSSGRDSDEDSSALHMPGTYLALPLRTQRTPAGSTAKMSFLRSVRGDGASMGQSYQTAPAENAGSVCTLPRVSLARTGTASGALSAVSPRPAISRSTTNATSPSLLARQPHPTMSVSSFQSTTRDRPTQQRDASDCADSPHASRSPLRALSRTMSVRKDRQRAKDRQPLTAAAPKTAGKATLRHQQEAARALHSLLPAI